jgi:hypothetical protein
LFREEFGLAESDQSKFRVVDLAHNLTEVGRTYERSIFLEQTLMVAQVIRVDLEIVASERNFWLVLEVA